MLAWHSKYRVSGILMYIYKLSGIHEVKCNINVFSPYYPKGKLTELVSYMIDLDRICIAELDSRTFTQRNQKK